MSFWRLRSMGGNHSLVVGKLDNPLPTGLTFKMAFFILCVSPWIPATLITPDFCVPPVVRSSLVFNWGQRFSDIPLLSLETNSLIIELNSGLRTMKISQKGREQGDIQLFQLLASQMFLWSSRKWSLPRRGEFKGKNKQTHKLLRSTWRASLGTGPLAEEELGCPPSGALASAPALCNRLQVSRSSLRWSAWNPWKTKEILHFRFHGKYFPN